MKGKEQNARDMWGTITRSNLHIIRVPGEERMGQKQYLRE